MKAKLVYFQELTKDNPTLCLNPLRVFNECHKCPNYQNERKHNRIDKLKCKPHINPRYLELIRKKRPLLDQLQQIEDEINKL